MEPSPQLEAYFKLCQRIYERHVRDCTWPWPVDSTNPEDVLESDSTENDI